MDQGIQSKPRSAW